MANTRRWRRSHLALVIAAALAIACGGDKATAPVPCDVYDGGNPSGSSLAGGYALVSLCQGVKPALTPPAASGTLSMTETAPGTGDFDATITITGQAAQTFAGPYTISGSAITVTLPIGHLAGTYTFSNDTLYVSTRSTGTLLSVVFHKTS